MKTNPAHPTSGIACGRRGAAVTPDATRRERPSNSPDLGRTDLLFAELIVHDPADQMKSFVTTTAALYRAGFGAIVGLIGGKAA